MSHRQQTGGTLALIVCTTLLIVIIGVGLFFIAQMIGGGREAQQATDSGNLNVAKKALIRPAINASSNEERITFDGLFANPANPEVNLQNYNKFVGKAFLVAINATADGNATGIAHARREIELVEGRPNGQAGIGERLWTALKTPANTDSFFGDVAQGNSIRMLHWNGTHTTNADDANYKVSFMKRSAPSNVKIETNPNRSQIPNGFNVNPAYFAVRGTKKYLIGYAPLAVGTLALMAVPVRPNEQPHLVNQEEFISNLRTPLANGSTSLIPPNAFESNSNSHEMHGGDVKLRSSAVVGSLSTEFNAQIPNGYVVVDNKVDIGQTDYNAHGESGQNNTVPGFTNDIFADVLMGAGVWVAPEDPFMAANANDFTVVRNAQKVGGNVPLSTLNGLDIKPVPDQSQLNTLHDNLVNNSNTFNCNHLNAFDPPCDQKLNDIQANYPPPGPPGPNAGPQNGLMAIEWLKAEVLRIRGGLAIGQSGCGDAYANGGCTGLKTYRNNQNYTDIRFGNGPSEASPTLRNLINQAQGAQAILDIKQRLHEINPTADDDAIFNRTVAFNEVRYLYNDPTTRLFVLEPTLPGSFVVEAGFQPDGTEITYNRRFPIHRTILNVEHEQGYPSPWDCFPDRRGRGAGQTSANSNGISEDKAKWQPSSGYKNLLGVLKLRNCASGGGRWCCPC